MNEEEKKRQVEKFLAQNTLVSPELLERLSHSDYVEIDMSTPVLRELPPSLPKKPAIASGEPKTTPPSIKLLFSYNEKSKKRDVQDFVDYFNARYALIEGMLRQRPELNNIQSISNLFHKTSAENVSLIGMVHEKNITKNHNIILALEDLTGMTKIIISKSKKDLFEAASDVVLDEVIGVTGTGKKDVVFANSIVFPDIPLKSKLKKSPYLGYAVFLSDIHVGSSQFMHEEFQRFLLWIQGKAGTPEQRDIAKRIKYVFIAGDVVDGVGIYPGQEKELTITDIYMQYEECARLLSQIPSSIRILICPGNHDATRISEPQPAFSAFAQALTKLPNATLLSNPCLVAIDATADFSGLNVLMYHGYSFDYYVANVNSIRQNGGYDRADLIMKFLLKRRHLAPTHTSTLYIPDAKTDPLFISTPPDIFITGHVHRTSVSHYRDVTLISGSCWQGMTPFQARLGHRPQPARVPVVDLHTRNVKILRFGKN